MACNYNLFDVINVPTPATPGGTWLAGQPSDPQNCLSPIVNNNPVGAVINPSTGFLDITNAQTGTYKFTYLVGTAPCEDCSTVTVTVAQSPSFSINPQYCREVTGESYKYICEQTFCNTAPVVNLYSTYLNNTPVTNPAITVVSGGSSPFNTSGAVSTHTFNPQTQTGSYELIYRRQVAESSVCTECSVDLKIRLTVVVDANAGTDGAVTLCRA